MHGDGAEDQVIVGSDFVYPVILCPGTVQNAREQQISPTETMLHNPSLPLPNTKTVLSPLDPLDLKQDEVKVLPLQHGRILSNRCLLVHPLRRLSPSRYRRDDLEVIRERRDELGRLLGFWLCGCQRGTRREKERTLMMMLK